MTFEEIKSVKLETDQPFRIRSISKKFQNIAINHKIAIPVEDISSYYQTSTDISIYDTSGAEIGILTFTKELGSISSSAMTYSQYIAYLIEANYSSRDDDYVFTKNYVVVNDDFYEEYMLKYRDTSSIWGGFNHLNGNPMTSYHKPIPKIDLLDVKFGNKIFKENAYRSVLQPFAFERFLKLYHLLELRFDTDVINEIKNLDLDAESEKIGDILGKYSKQELPRLEYIIQNNCADITSIVTAINNVKFYSHIAEQIFYVFGKESNPLKDFSKFTSLLPIGFDLNNLRTYGVQQWNNHPKFIHDLAAYWIYRIRCSIAHNKIGEYILSYNDEEFIVEFAEPLLKEIIKQTFKS